MTLLTSGAILASTSAMAADSDLLTGDTRLACEAILCLSSAASPSECKPSLRRYFRINTRHTIRDRFHFLQMCPSSSEKGMNSLIKAIANGAGRCDAAALNKRGRWVGSYREGRTFILDTTFPDYCRQYHNHELVDSDLASSVKLVTKYCPNPAYRPNRFNREPKEIECGKQWVDVK